MQKLVKIISLVIIMVSCRNNLIPLEETILDKARDTTAPEIEITSPLTDSLFGQTVTISGTVYDNGKELPTLKYEVVNNLGEIKSQNTIELIEENTDQGIRGNFSYTINTSNMDSDVLLNLTATDWNNNEITAPALRLLYPGSAISSFNVTAQNNQLLLKWIPIEGAEKYTVFYSNDQEIFMESTAGKIYLSPSEIGEKASLSLNKEEHGIKNGHLTKVRVKAESATDSWVSPVLSAVPVSPFTLIPKSNCYTNRIDLIWKAFTNPTGDPIYYSVWKGLSPDGSFSLISPESLETSFFSDSSVNQNQIYYYKIGYKTGQGVESLQLSEAFPASPTNLSTSISSQSSVQQLLTSNTNQVKNVAFSEDGQRAFAVNWIDEQHSRLIETNVKTGVQSGQVIDFQSVTEAIYPGSKVEIMDLTVCGDRVYASIFKNNGSQVSDKLYGVISIDISSTGNMRIMNSETITLPGNLIPYHLVLGRKNSKNTLFIQAGPRNFYHVDISLPTSPGSVLEYSNLTSLYTSGVIYNMSYRNGYLYILYKETSDGTEINIASYDVNSSAKSEITILSGSDIDDDYGPFYITADESSPHLLVAAKGAQNIYHENPTNEGYIWSYNIQSNPAIPTLEKFKDMGIRIESIGITGNKAYCATYNGYILIGEISSSDILRRSEISVRGYGIDLDFHEGTNSIILASDSSAMSYIQFDDISPPLYGDSISLGFGGISNNGIATDGTHLYVPVKDGNEKLKSFRVHQDGTFTLNSYIDIKAKNVLVRGRYLFTGYSDLISASMSQIGTVSNLSLLKTIHLMDDVNAMDIWGDYLYLSEGNSGVEIFDISDPYNPVSVGWVNSWSKSTEILVSNDRLYMLDSGYGIRCYDVSDPEDPRHLGDFQDTSSDKKGWALTSSGNYIYYATNTGFFALKSSEAADWQNAATGSGNIGSAISWCADFAQGLNAQGDVLYAVKNISGADHVAAYNIKNPGRPELFYTDYENTSSSNLRIEIFGKHMYSWIEHNLFPLSF